MEKVNPLRLLPHYSRGITASFKKYLLLILVVIEAIFCLGAIFLFFLLLSWYFDSKQSRAQELAHLSSWEKIAVKHPTYPQALYEVAVRAARLNDNQKAREYIERALLLNPNFEPAKKLQEEIGE